MPMNISSAQSMKAQALLLTGSLPDSVEYRRQTITFIERARSSPDRNQMKRLR